MNVLRLSWVILPFIALFFAAASAGEVKQIYQAEVDVGSRGEEDRNAAIRRAMKIVLARMVLKADLDSQPVIVELLTGASRFAQTYQYTRVSDADPPDAGQGGYLLRVYFDGDNIRRMLQQERVAVWGANRPSILVWMVVEQKGHRRMFQPEMMPDLHQALIRSAREQGLSLVLPLLDLTDQGNLSAADLWAGFDERVIQASSRYDADIILVGRLAQISAAAWDAQWRMRSGDDVAKWGKEGYRLETVFEEGMREVYTRLFPYYAARGTGSLEAGVKLRIAGLADLSDFTRVVHYIESLGQVDTVEWSKLEPAAVTFRLQLESDPESLKQALATSRLLAKDLLLEQETGLLQYRIKP